MMLMMVPCQSTVQCFCADGDAALFFEIGRVHHPLFDAGILPEDAGGAEDGVDECGLAVVDVGHDGEIAYLAGGYHGCRRASSEGVNGGIPGSVHHRPVLGVVPCLRRHGGEGTRGEGGMQKESSGAGVSAPAVVIMAGGVGTRFWPASTGASTKAVPPGWSGERQLPTGGELRAGRSVALPPTASWS